MTQILDTATADAALATDPAASAAALDDLLDAFRAVQLHHARVLHHESTARGIHQTDLRFIYFLSAEPGTGVTPKQGGEYLELSTGAMTSLVDRLERLGHIERRPNPEDRRSVLVHLTDSGRELAAGIGAVYREAFRASIPSESLAPLSRAFAQVGAALEQRSGR